MNNASFLQLDVSYILEVQDEVERNVWAPRHISSVAATVHLDILNKASMLNEAADICTTKIFLKLKRPVEEVIQTMYDKSDSDYSAEIAYLGVKVIFIVFDIKLSTTDLIKYISNVFTKSAMFGHFHLTHRRIDESTMNASHITGIFRNDIFRLLDNLNIDPYTFDIFFNSFNDLADGNAILPLEGFRDGRCVSTVSVEPAPFCAKVGISSDHVDRVYGQSAVSHINGRTLVFNQYVLSEMHDKVFVCWEDYFANIEEALASESSTMKTTEAHISDNSDMVILTIVCISMSLASLVVVLFVYGFLPNLHSVPGFNNMALSVSLFVYQTMTLTNSLTEVQTSWLCSGIGTVLHFSLLSSFFWMFICTFHMARTFVLLRINSVTNENVKQFVRYLVTVESASLILVGGVFLYTYTVSDTPMAYGGSPCYVTDPRAILYFVAIPAAVVIFSNFVMFVIVIVKIVRIPDMTSKSTHERRNVVIFAKLSTITGLTWMFVFIHQFSELKLFAYLSIMFNAGQGVFIMFAFVVNRRVLDMIRRRRQETRQSKYTSKSSLKGPQNHIHEADDTKF